MQQPPVTNEDVTCFREFQSIYARDQRIADATIYEIDSRLRKCEELHKRHGSTIRSGPGSTCSIAVEHVVMTPILTRLGLSRQPTSDDGVAAGDGNRMPNANVFCSSPNVEYVRNEWDSPDDDCAVPIRVRGLFSPPASSRQSSCHTATTSAVGDQTPRLDTPSRQDNSRCTTHQYADLASDLGVEAHQDSDSPSSPCTTPCPSLSEREEDISLESESLQSGQSSSSPCGSAPPSFIPCAANRVGVICPRLSFGLSSLWSCRYHANEEDVGICASG